jgi:predicted transglutaminase-like cysteine proteinase
MTATPEQIAELQAVNAQVNAIPYRSAPGQGEPPDWWSDTFNPAWSFVCRDYVEDKAEALRSRGWPVADLLTVLTWTEVVGDPSDQWGGRQYHCVLRVNAGGDIYILDSRVQDPAQIYLASESVYDYRWDREQVAGTNGYQDISTTGIT